MKYSYQYLSDDFPGAAFRSLDMENTCSHKDTALGDILYSPVVKPEEIFQETALPFEPPLEQKLQQDQIGLILKLFRMEGFDESTIDFSMTMTQFDAFLQGLQDKGENIAGNV